MPHATQYQLTSVVNYLEQEQLGDTRHEYMDGDVYAMSGASELRNAVTAELFASIYAQLPDECRAFIADMKVKVEINDKVFFSGDTFKLESVALEMTVDKIYRKVRREVGLDIL